LSDATCHIGLCNRNLIVEWRLTDPRCFLHRSKIRWRPDFLLHRKLLASSENDCCGIGIPHSSSHFPFSTSIPYTYARTANMCPSPSPQTALASILVRSERQVDWSRRSSSSRHGTSVSNHAAPTRRSVTFAPKTNLRPIPSICEMTPEEIVSVWRTPCDRVACTSEISETVQIVRNLEQYPALQEDQYCVRGIEIYIDEGRKQQMIQQRRLIVLSVLAKQEEQRRRYEYVDPTKSCNLEKELANLAATISRESVKKARIVAKKDMMAARGMHISTSTSSSQSLSVNRQSALIALKRDNSQQYRERQLFVRQMLPRRYHNNDAESSVTSASSSDSSHHRTSSTGRRCRIAAKTA